MRRHLRVEIDAYDQTIRRFVPGYEEMLRVAAGQVATAAQGGLVLELGAGTGALSEATLGNGEVGAVELIDTDPEMLERARARLARFQRRARFREGSFDEPFPPCNAVAASLTLHHVPSMDRKRALYRRIRDALLPGGVFVNADVTMPASPPEREATCLGWKDHMASYGIDETPALRHFEELGRRRHVLSARGGDGSDAGRGVRHSMRVEQRPDGRAGGREGTRLTIAADDRPRPEIRPAGGRKPSRCGSQV